MQRAAWFAMAVLLGAAPASAQIVSTFDTNSEGWTILSFQNLSANQYGVFGTYGATYVSSGGNPGGYIAETDPDNGDYTYRAPAAFKGDLSAALGGTLSYDFILTTGTVDYQTTDVIFEGGGQRLLYRGNPQFVPTSSWGHVVVPISPSPEWLLGTTGGSQATLSDFRTVLASVTDIFIRGEYSFSSTEASGLDNVQLTLNPIPEPSTVGLVALAVLCGAYRGFRKRKAA